MSTKYTEVNIDLDEIKKATAMAFICLKRMQRIKSIVKGVKCYTNLADKHIVHNTLFDDYYKVDNMGWKINPEDTPTANIVYSFYAKQLVSCVTQAKALSPTAL